MIICSDGLLAHLNEIKPDWTKYVSAVCSGLLPANYHAKVIEFSLAKIRAKTLVISGSEDQIMVPASQMAQKIPGAKYFFVRGLDHSVGVGWDILVYPEILRFLNISNTWTREREMLEFGIQSLNNAPPGTM